MDLSPRELIDAGLDALVADAPPLTSALRGRVLDAVHTSVRPSWTGRGDALTSQAAFVRTAAELGQLLEMLTPADWSTATGVEGSTVRDLVVHLAGVERYVLGQLGRRPVLEAPRREDHYPTAKAAAADLAGADDQAVARGWWHDAMALVAASSELGPDHPVDFHHLSGTLDGLLVIRTFELWTHDDDIRRATGRALNNLDDARLSLMSGQLMDLLGRGMALMGTAQPRRTARLQLTGLGAGSFDIALAPDEVPGRPDVTITVAAVELCRLAANRLAPGDLRVDVEGDRSLVAPILVGAGAFALD
jgi:uncharacterized protein (TIGR03083 family)